MKIDIEAIRNDTKTGLTGDEDLSHLTEEIVEEARANAKTRRGAFGRHGRKYVHAGRQQLEVAKELLAQSR